MKVSQKASYAVRALLDLVLHAPDGGALRSAEIAARAGIPEKFLEAIFVDLRKAGLISSRRGPEGGHRLARPAAAVTLGAIRAAVDGPLVLAAEEPRPARRADAVDRAVQGAWQDVERAVARALDGITLEDLQRRVDQQRNVVDFNI